ncbi:hypothetical protein [Candidatus Enterococcus ferrettii]
MKKYILIEKAEMFFSMVLIKAIVYKNKVNYQSISLGYNRIISISDFF